MSADEAYKTLAMFVFAGLLILTGNQIQRIADSLEVIAESVQTPTELEDGR